ncbi:MAG TPA: hypothetical protein VGJ15_04660 [Pirellulales bacterium]
MLIDREHLAEHKAWIALVTVVALAAAGWYAVQAIHSGRLPGGASAQGLVFGIGGAIIMLFEFLLWPRKHFRVLRIGMVKVWMRAHIWLGLLTVPLILLHSGFTWGGQLSTLLALVFIVVIASGIYGLWMQQWLPKLMLNELPAETIVSQVDHVARNLCEDAEQLVAATCGLEADEITQWRGAEPAALVGEPEMAAGPRYVTIGALRQVGNVQGRVLQTQVVEAVPGSEPLAQSFKKDIGPFIWSGGHNGTMLADPGKASNYFRQLRTALDPRAHTAVDVLESYCDQRRQFDRQIRLHRWLHGWLLIHLPLSIVLMVLMFIHAYVALKYR